MVISASRQACGVVFPLAISTSICRSSVTICSGLYFFMGIPASLQSEFSLTPAGTKIPRHVSLTEHSELDISYFDIADSDHERDKQLPSFTTRLIPYSRSACG